MTPLQEFYSGRSIFVTGGTGFMGKVFLEKILRSVQDLDKIYVLLRSKKGKSPKERIQEFTRKPPFTFQHIDPERFEKLVAIEGDIGLESLGLSEKDRSVLINDVSVVFHLAASIRMDMNLKEAVKLNVLGTQAVLDLCVQMKNLVSVIHLSTAFCNVDIDYMEEKVYPLSVDPRQIIDLVSWMTEEDISRIQKRIISPHPNTYTFTKRLAEIVVSKMSHKLPIAIVRPSIVIPAVEEPVPGWVDTYNGPVGLLVAGGKGVVKSMLMNTDCMPQVIPVDIAINSLLFIAFHLTLHKYNDVLVINATQNDIVKVKWATLIVKFRQLAIKYPYKKMFWYPNGDATKNYFVYYFWVIFGHFLPAYIVDFLLIIFFQKPFMVDLQKRIQLGLDLLQYFVLRQWTFVTKQGVEIVNSFAPEDLEVFPILNSDRDVDRYIRKSFFGSRKYLLKEDLDYLPLYRLQLAFLYVLDKLFKVAVVYGLIWLLLYMFDATHVLPWHTKVGSGFKSL